VSLCVVVGYCACVWLLLDLHPQRSVGLAKDLDETVTRIETQEHKATAELAARKQSLLARAQAAHPNPAPPARASGQSVVVVSRSAPSSTPAQSSHPPQNARARAPRAPAPTQKAKAPPPPKAKAPPHPEAKIAAALAPVSKSVNISDQQKVIAVRSTGAAVGSLSAGAPTHGGQQAAAEGAHSKATEKKTNITPFAALPHGGLRAAAIPTVQSVVLIKHEPANMLELRQEEKLFQILARIGARRPDLLMERSSPVFSAAAAAASSEVEKKMLHECREQLVSECCTAGLDPLDEGKIGFAVLPPAKSHSGLALGFLALIDAAVVAGAVQVMYSGGVWQLQCGTRVAKEGGVWMPPVVDVSLRFVVNLQAMPMEEGENVRVSETKILFQIKVCEEAPIQRELLQKPKKPPKEPASAAKAKGVAKEKSFWLKVRGVRVGKSQVYIRLGIQPKLTASAGAATADTGSSKAPPVCWGPWNSSPLCIFVSSDANVTSITHANVPSPRGQPAGLEVGQIVGKRKATSASSGGLVGEQERLDFSHQGRLLSPVPLPSKKKARRSAARASRGGNVTSMPPNVPDPQSAPRLADALALGTKADVYRPPPDEGSHEWAKECIGSASQGRHVDEGAATAMLAAGGGAAVEVASAARHADSLTPSRRSTRSQNKL